MAEEASLAIILRARDEASKTIGEAEGTLVGLGKAALAVGAVSIVAIAGIAAESAHLAANFQYTTETLVTGAGEDQKAMGMIRQGVLDMAGEVGQTPQHLAEGLYLIESAGYHGAAGLTVLKAASMGATVGAAQTAEVADALTSALNAYRLPATQAAHVTDILLTTVAAGKMHLSDLAANIGKVLPIASIAKIPLSELGAAIATMTAQGTDASMATTALRFLITNLISPSSAAATEMKKMGLSAKDLSTELSSKGLAATMATIQEQIGKHFPVGSQAYIAAMDKIVGGTRGMTAALELTGPNLKTFIDNATAVGHASDGAGKLQQGWEEHSKDFNIVMERLHAGLEAVMITIGNKMLPVMTRLALWFVDNLPSIQRFADALVNRVGQAINDVQYDVGIIMSSLQSLRDEFDKHKQRYEVLAAFILAVVSPTLIAMAVAFGVSVVTGLVASTTALIANTVATVSNAYYKNLMNALLLVYYVRLGVVTAATTLWSLATGAYNAVAMLFVGIQNQGIVGMARFLAAMIAQRIATAAATVQQWLMNAAFLANPVGLIIIGIAALAAGIVYAYQHSETFRNIVNGLWDAIKSFAGWIWSGLKPALDWLWNMIKNLAQMAANFLGAISGLGNVKLPGGLHVPGFASGAVVRGGYGGVLAQVGEGAEDEVVATATQMAAVGRRLDGGGSGVQTIIVPVTIDGRVIAQVVAEYNGKKFNLQGGRLGSGA